MINDVSKIRFKEDDLSKYKDLLEKINNNDLTQRMELLSNSLKTSHDITPEISKIIDKVVSKLEVTDINIECYIYNSETMNASCFSLRNDSNIIIVLNSGLVNAMNMDELAFVIGHEIGHYLLGHLNYVKTESDENHITDMKINRLLQSQEISADRVGLICSGSIESSLRAIIKTVSGLDDKFITRNLHTYLHQLHLLDFDHMSELYNYSHPIFPIRAKSLMLFSMSELYYNWIGEIKKAPFNTETLEKKIVKDLESTTLKKEKDIGDELSEKFKLWFFIKSFNEGGIISEREINFLENCFGSEMTNKAVIYARNNPMGVNNKYLEFKSNVECLSSSIINELLQEMETSIHNSFNDHKIQKYFLNIKRSLQ